MSERIEVLLDEETVDAKVREIGQLISKDYAGKEVHMICILKGGVYFMTELSKRVDVPVTMDFMAVSSYGAGTESTGRVKIIKDLDDPIEGKEVLIVEDIVDTGRTLKNLRALLEQRNPNSIKICTLLDKPDRRVVDIEADYSCFVIPNEFVVGYGLDYAQKYRNLPYIGIVKFDEEK